VLKIVTPSALQIYVVDSMDRDRIGVAREEFQAVVKDPLMLNSVILVLANKQDMVTSDPIQPNRGTEHEDN
jgi:Arf/Sar family protein